jgi:hypothetical protein
MVKMKEGDDAVDRLGIGLPKVRKKKEMTWWRPIRIYRMVEIDDPAHAEIIRLSAERVMGWTSWKSPMAGPNDPDDCWATGNDESPSWRKSGWNPLTSISDAWMLVEKLRGPANWSALHVNSASFCMEFSMGKTGIANCHSESAPRAITYAALRACGEKV